MADDEPNQAHNVQGIPNVAGKLVHGLIALIFPLPFELPSHLRQVSNYILHNILRKHIT